MTNTILRRILILNVLISAAFSSYAQQNEAPTTFSLKYQLKQGDQFQIKQHSQQDSYLNLDGVEQRTTNQRDAVIHLTITTVNNVQATIEVTYEQINLQSSSQDQNISVNTTTDNNSIYNRLFKAMIGKKFTLVMQPDGTIKSISGLGPIFDQMIAAVPEVKENERPVLKKFLQSQLGSEALKASLAFVLPHYPVRDVQINGSWMNLLYTDGFYPGRIDNYWKLDYGDKYAINLSNKGKFVTDSSREVDLGGGERGFVDLKGEVQGKYTVDPETYWPTMCITHTELNGNYIYKAQKKRKKDIAIPVRVVMDASYQFKHL
jgi:hypothetical protein